MPKYLIEMCESSRDAQTYAQKLFNLSVPNEINSEDEDELLQKVVDSSTTIESNVKS